MPNDKKRGTVPDSYVGREQAFIKHELLKAYLGKLFLIIGMSSPRIAVSELCYVDCFSGPWATGSENLSDTSIGVSIQILDKCQKELRARGINLRFRALYVEKDDRAFARLEKFLTDHGPTSIESKPLHGDFIELRKEILNWCGAQSFAFFFIDPKGWKEVGVDTLRPLLQRRKSEFLINFMYEFINRTVSMSERKLQMTAHFGEPVDVEDVDGIRRERLLVDTYRKNLKHYLPATQRSRARSAHVRVLDRKKERPKYHLVYLTSHPRGVIEFMKISQDLDLVQKRVRASTKQAERVNKSGQQEMFDEQELVDVEAGHVDVNLVKQYWCRYLAKGKRRIGEEEFADLLERTDWFENDLQRALGLLIDEGIVRNLDAPRKRPKRPLHWEKEGERLELVENAQ